MPVPKMPPQVTRLVLLTLAIVAVYSLARYFLTPPTFGQLGWYRAAALGEIAAKNRPVYAGREACIECHSEVAQELAKYEHKTVGCESCHGPRQSHADNPDLKTDPRAGSPCMRCHQANPARPAWVRQIRIKEHYTGQRCTECHKPHQPNEAP